MFSAFREIVVADFEFAAAPGERPAPLCLVAHELRSGRRIGVWEDQFGSAPPYATGPDVLFVAYYASRRAGLLSRARLADAGAHPRPLRRIPRPRQWLADPRRLQAPRGAFLLRPRHASAPPKRTRCKRRSALALGAAAITTRAEILDYCESDVVALERLLPAMLPRIDLPRALLRGRYMAAAAAMEYHGTPIDAEMLARLRERWDGHPGRADRRHRRTTTACSKGGPSRPIASSAG